MKSPVDVVVAEHAEMLAMLRDLEFVDTMIKGRNFRLCPNCHSAEHDPEYCELAALLKRMES